MSVPLKHTISFSKDEFLGILRLMPKQFKKKKTEVINYFAAETHTPAETSLKA